MGAQPPGRNPLTPDPAWIRPGAAALHRHHRAGEGQPEYLALWQQHADWTAELPRHSVTSVSIHPAVWRLLGNRQEKIEPSFHHGRWHDPAVAVPRRDDGARTALAEAVALVEAGRSREVRRGLARVLAAEPAISRRWLRALATELRR